MRAVEPKTLALWPHQERAAAFLAEHNAALLKLPMGSGKTRIVANALDRPSALPALILTKRAVVTDGIWERELGPLGIDCLPLTGPVSIKANQLVQRAAQGKSFACLVNYESSWREPLASVILRVPWKTVALDESHMVKSPGSKVSLFAKRLGRTPYRICLSGTPMAQGPLDVYGQFRFLNPSIYGTSFKSFRSRYAVMGGYEGRQVIAYQNEPEFMRRFWMLTFSVEDSELAYSLPPDSDIALTHTLPPAALKLYADLETEFWSAIEDSSITIPNAAVKLLRLQQIASGHIRDDEGATRTVHTERAELLAGWLEDVDPAEPVVVFCRFRHDLSEVKRIATQLQRPCSELSGSANELTDWKEGKTTILAVQIQSGGTGIDLTRASLAVYYSVGHSLSDYLQSRARLVRPGQMRPVRFYHLTARSSVDSKVYAALRSRQDVIQSLLSIEKGSK